MRGIAVSIFLWALAARAAPGVSDLEQGFSHPPASARPWVNWFWVDGNISREGITADLEAMQRVGIGGALLMDVTQEIPAGPIHFNQPEWHALFQRAASEARRLGLELSLNNAPGWSGSGGPWITPELAMQKVAWSRTTVTGPAHFQGELNPLQLDRNYLQPIATLAFPQFPLPPMRIHLHQAKTGMSRATSDLSIDPASGYTAFRGAVQTNQIVDLTSRTDARGVLDWDVPKGKWTVLRFGATLTGMENHPVPPEGHGLECDKLSREAIEKHFEAFLAPLIKEAAGAETAGLTGLHIDSWEVGFQNWTPRFREEFHKRRGYDLLRYLPTYTGQIVENLDQSERFLWDVRRTIADLQADNYAGHLARLAHEHGLKLSIEAYANGPFDNLLYASRSDFPMGEFWAETEDYSRFHTCKSMASAAHIYGKAIVPAEAFTSYPATARWLNHPWSLKALADAAFCEGINRLVIHRYAHQPWLNRRPGMTMGRFGVHYERTQTWWEQSRPWHEYLARCQFLLQSGHFVADVCYLGDENAYAEPPTRANLHPPLPPGYEYDVITPDALLTRVSVRDGLLALPDGARYRLLVLPRFRRMTPQLLGRVKQLLAEGAAIIGPLPTNSPSLSDFPNCERELRSLVASLRPHLTNGEPIALPSQRTISDISVSKALDVLHLPPDFRPSDTTARFPLRWIHRQIDNAHFYFVANSNDTPVTVNCAFRVTGFHPEIWHPDSGQIETAAQWQASNQVTRIPLHLDRRGSCFVVFRKPTGSFDPVVALSRNGAPETGASLGCDANDRLELLTSHPGKYRATTASGQHWQVDIPNLPQPNEVDGPWEVSFAPDLGGPSQTTFPRLISWTHHREAGIKYYSGQAIYRKRVSLPNELFVSGTRLDLDLGRVEVIAEVRLNGRDLGKLWKPPFILDVTQVARAGQNELEIRIVNLWPNRLIGDEQLPDDCRWKEGDAAFGAALAEWPSWLLEGKARPSGRIGFATWKHWKKDSPLLESGLLGPVKFQVRARARLNPE